MRWQISLCPNGPQSRAGIKTTTGESGQEESPCFDHPMRESEEEESRPRIRRTPPRDVATATDPDPIRTIIVHGSEDNGGGKPDEHTTHGVDVAPAGARNCEAGARVGHGVPARIATAYDTGSRRTGAASASARGGADWEGTRGQARERAGTRDARGQARERAGMRAGTREHEAQGTVSTRARRGRRVGGTHGSSTFWKGVRSQYEMPLTPYL